MSATSKSGTAGLGRGAYAEYVLVEVAERSYHPPEHVGFEEAATFEPFGTAGHGRAGRPEGRRDRRHPGAGIIGLGAVQAIRATTSACG